MAQIPQNALSRIAKQINTIPVIFQPPKREIIPDTSVVHTNSQFANVGMSDEEKNKRYQNSIRPAGGVGGGGIGDGKDSDKDKEKDEGGGDEEEDGFSIFKILKIVPIGINVLAKAPDLASGFADLAVGTATGLINLSISSLDLFISTFEFSIQGFKFMLILLMCLLENMSNLNACILFYLIDLILLLVFLTLFSILKLLDVMFMVRMTGISLADLVLSAGGPIYEFDEYVHSLTGFHLIHYPDYIINMCYTCSIKLNTKETSEKGAVFADVVTNIIPGRIGEPLGKITSAFGKFASIFDL